MNTTICSGGRGSVDFTGIIQLVQIHLSRSITQIQIQIQIPFAPAFPHTANIANADNSLITQIQPFLISFQTTTTTTTTTTVIIPTTLKIGRTPCRGQLKRRFGRLGLERCRYRCKCGCGCRCAAVVWDGCGRWDGR